MQSASTGVVLLLSRSHNAIIDYKTRGRDYDTQHNDFHNTDTPNKFIAYGALVGGPQSDDRYALGVHALLLCLRCSAYVPVE